MKIRSIGLLAAVALSVAACAGEAPRFEDLGSRPVQDGRAAKYTQINGDPDIWSKYVAVDRDLCPPDAHYPDKPCDVRQVQMTPIPTLAEKIRSFVVPLGAGAAAGGAAAAAR